MRISSIASSSRSLELRGLEVSGAIARLASGQRLQRAADDPGVVQFVQSNQARMRGAQEAVRNMQTAIAFTQFALDGVQGVVPVLQQMRELVIRAGDGALNASQRSALQSEIDELKPLVTDAQSIAIGARIDYGAPAGARQITYQLGPSAGETLTIDYDPLAVVMGELLIFAAQINVNNIGASLDVIDRGMSGLLSFAGYLGASINQMQRAADEADNQAVSMAAALSRVADTDFGEASQALAKAATLQRVAFQSRALSIEQARERIARLLETGLA